MRKLSETEMLSLRELLQMETNALSQGYAVQSLVQDKDLKAQIDSSILAVEGRIKGIQQFIQENKIINPSEVH